MVVANSENSTGEILPSFCSLLSSCSIFVLRIHGTGQSLEYLDLASKSRDSLGYVPQI